MCWQDEENGLFFVHCLEDGWWVAAEVGFVVCCLLLVRLLVVGSVNGGARQTQGIGFCSNEGEVRRNVVVG